MPAYPGIPLPEEVKTKEQRIGGALGQGAGNVIGNYVMFKDAMDKEKRKFYSDVSKMLMENKVKAMMGGKQQELTPDFMESMQAGKPPRETTFEPLTMPGGATPYEAITFDPETGQYKKVATGEAVTQIPKGQPVGITKPSIERQAEVKEKTAAVKAYQTYVPDANQALLALEKMENYAEKLGDFDTGLVSQLYAKGKTKVQEISKDPGVSLYIGVVSQELIPAARKLMEEKGPITEFDVSRVEKGLGDITAPLAQKLTLLSELRNKVKEALKAKMELAGIPMNEFKQKNPTLYNKLYQGEAGQDVPAELQVGEKFQGETILKVKKVQ